MDMKSIENTAGGKHPIRSRNSALTGLKVAAFIALAVNLRAPLTSLPSVIDAVRGDLRISAAAAGLLTTIPVLCFGVLAPLAAAALRRLSIERAVMLTLAGVILGSVARSLGGMPLVVAGTVILGGALTLGNIVSLMVIARDFPRRAGLMTGVLVMAMSIGAMLSAGLTAPLTSLFHWRVALASWAALAVIGLLLWLAVAHGSAGQKDTPPPAFGPAKPVATRQASGRVWRQPAVRRLTLAFASHTFMFYGLTAWLPDYLMQAADMNVHQAGISASLFQILGILGCFGVPWLKSYLGFDALRLFWVVGVSWLLMPAGLLLAPAAWPLWVVLGGIGSGGGFSVVFMLVMSHAADLDENRRISSFVQGVSYIVASTAPVVVGGVHQFTGEWGLAWGIVIAAALLMLYGGSTASRLMRLDNNR
ncbi:MFS transporter [Martelella alba]|nr:MFS transporter [Martelella alba]